MRWRCAAQGPLPSTCASRCRCEAWHTRHLARHRSQRCCCLHALCYCCRLLPAAATGRGSWTWRAPPALAGGGARPARPRAPPPASAHPRPERPTPPQLDYASEQYRLDPKLAAALGSTRLHSLPWVMQALFVWLQARGLFEVRGRGRGRCCLPRRPSPQRLLPQMPWSLHVTTKPGPGELPPLFNRPRPLLSCPAPVQPPPPSCSKTCRTRACARTMRCVSCCRCLRRRRV